ncbi:MAG: ABC transporter ATP-binding protein [Burkholderiaceae bacterium]|jgi:putative ABC transport system ATP-binding protein
MLKVEGLGKRYGDHWIFQNVDFQVEPGEVVAVLGESGVGKSTLLNGLAALDSVEAGRIQLDSMDVLSLDSESQALWRRHHVGFVFQAFHVLPHLTVAQNVALPLMLLNAPRAQRDARVREMLQAVGLEGFDAREPRTLSGGQLQRVAIARALAHRPNLVLADEPTGNLDPQTAGRVIDLLRQQVREMKAACVLVTHSEAAAGVADRVLRLQADGMWPA